MWDEKYKNELLTRREKVLAAGGTSKVEKQHEKGKLTARERLLLLFDKDTFVEVGSMIETQSTDFEMEKKKTAGDGVITGYGLINGRRVCASSEDFTVIGGTIGECHARKICDVMDMALEMKAPFVSLNDSGGARIEEGISALNGCGDIFYRHTKASGVIPQIAVILGPCAGAASYAPALCDFVFVTEKTSRMFITGPGVVKTVVGEVVSDEELGGAKIHAEMSGVAHFCYPTDELCLQGVRELLSYLPQETEEDGQDKESVKTEDCSALLEDIVPDNQKRVYDVRDVIRTLADEDSFFEVQTGFGTSIVIGFFRMDSRTVGIVANQPNHIGGSIDVDAAEKAARFVRFCDCFGIPILTLVDVPGFMPGTKQEFSGIIRRGAKLLYAYSEATVPKVTLILRKAYGGAYISMGSKSLGADFVYAWPIAQIAVMGAESAVDIVFRNELRAAEEKETTREELISRYNERFMSPYVAATRGYIDEVILPEETKERISSAFGMLKEKKKNVQGRVHGNIPL